MALTKIEIEALQAKHFFRFEDATPAPFTSTNINMPAGILAALSPAVIENVLAKRTGEEALGQKSKVVDWAEDKYFMPFVEKAGQTSPYADHSTPLNTSLNVSFNSTGHYTFSSAIIFGNRQAQQFAKARVNYADMLMKSATEALAVEMNRTAFNGYIDNGAMLVYGLLNNPALDNYTASNKTFNAMTWQEVMAFFAGAIKALQTKSGNNINGQSKIRCVISASAFAELQGKYTDLGVSVYETITKTYPKIEFVSAIELDNAYNGNANAIYFIGEDSIGGLDKTTDLGYSEIALLGNVVQEANGYSQVVSAGTTGALIYKPMFIVRYQGV